MKSRIRRNVAVSCSALIVAVVLSLASRTAFPSVYTLVYFYNTDAAAPISLGSNWHWTLEDWVVADDTELESGSLANTLAYGSFDAQLLSIAVDRPSEPQFDKVNLFDEVVVDEVVFEEANEISTAGVAGDDGFLIDLATNPIMDSSSASDDFLGTFMSDAFSGVELDALRTGASSPPSLDKWRR